MLTALTIALTCAVIAGYVPFLVTADHWFGIRQALHFEALLPALGLLTALLWIAKTPPLPIHPAATVQPKMPARTSTIRRALPWLMWIATIVLYGCGIQNYYTLRDGWAQPLLWGLGLFLLGLLIRFAGRAGATFLGNLVALLAGQTAVALLAKGLSEGQIEITVTGVTLVIFAGIIFIRRGLPPVYWVALLGMAVYSYPLNLPRFSWVGDEYAFFDCAKLWIAGESSTPLILFNSTAMYSNQCSFTCAFQGAFMMLFGVDNFGWRISNAFVLSWSIVFLDSFFAHFLHAGMRSSVALFLATSAYLIAFGRIGYNNLQALLGMSMTLAAAGQAIAKGTPAHWATFGIAAGFNFYLFPTAASYVPWAALMVLLLRPSCPRALLATWGVMAACFIGITTPILMQETLWSSKVAGTAWAASMQGEHALSEHMLRTFKKGLLLPWYTDYESHFVISSYVDPLGGSLLTLGAAYLLFTLIRKPSRLLLVLLLSYLGEIFVLTSLGNYSSPKATRMFMLLPYYGVGVAAGVECLRQLFSKVLSPQLSRSVGVLLWISILALNLVQAYHVGARRLPLIPETIAMQVITQLQRQGITKIAICDRRGELQLAGAAEQWKLVYRNELAAVQFSKFGNGSDGPCNLPHRLDIYSAAILTGKQELEPALRNAIDAPESEHFESVVNDSGGKKLFSLICPKNIKGRIVLPYP